MAFTEAEFAIEARRMVDEDAQLLYVGATASHHVALLDFDGAVGPGLEVVSNRRPSPHVEVTHDWDLPTTMRGGEEYYSLRLSDGTSLLYPTSNEGTVYVGGEPAEPPAGARVAEPAPAAMA